LSTPTNWGRQSFIYATYPRVSRQVGTTRATSIPLLFGLAPGGVYRAPDSHLSGRWALTSPFHPCHAMAWWFVFCGTFRSRSNRDLRFHRAPCPMEFGLSSLPQGGRATARHFQLFNNSKYIPYQTSSLHNN